jgi:mannose-6-phosphate isomerase
VEDNCAVMASNPVFFKKNRVFRVYRGGKLFHDFFGDESTDGSYPEEWIASKVRALNRNSSQLLEGISQVRGDDIYFDQLLSMCKDLMIGDRDDFGILVKVLDSAIRLPAQVHPDKEFSKKYFNSQYGKTEMWYVLATRENAKIYFGFKEGISRAQLESAIQESETEKDAMALLMNEIPARKGDVYFIPAKMIHAIGYGCLILEVQEPTDFTIQPEMWCGDYRLNEYEMFLGLSHSQALECFDFSIKGSAAISKGKITPYVKTQSEAVCSEVLIGEEHTPCFSVNRHRISKGQLTIDHAPSVFIVTEGEGILQKDTQSWAVKKGDYFFVPFKAKNLCAMSTQANIELIECLP